MKPAPPAKRDTKTFAGAQKRNRHWASFVPVPFMAFFCVAAAVVLLFPFSSTFEPFDLPKEGEPAPETIIAPFTFDIYKLPDELKREQEAAENQVLLVLDYDDSVARRVQAKFRELRNAIADLSAKETSDSVKASVRAQLIKTISTNTIDMLKQLPYLIDDAMLQVQQALEQGVLAVKLVEDEQELMRVRERYRTLGERYFMYTKEFATLRRDSVEMTVKTNDIPVKEQVLNAIITTLKQERLFDQQALNSVYELVYHYLRPNVFVNAEETARRKQQARKAILPVKGKVVKDSEITRKHQEITFETLEKLLSLRIALQETRKEGRYRKVIAGNAGRILLVIMIVLLLGAYLRIFRPQKMHNPKWLAAFGTILVFQLLIIRLSIILVPKLFKGSPELTSLIPEFLIPTAVGAVLMALLFDLEISIAFSVFIATYFGIILGFNHYLFLYALLGGLVAGFSHKNIRYRLDFFKAIPPLFIAYGCFITVWHLLNYNFWPGIIQNLGLGLLNCVSTTFLAMMSVTAFEHLFDISTNMTLVELADMNHPVLKRLSIEAAGTYNHSVLVGNLAESAAEKIGANALLARVASYYHDIGKIEKSTYFIENHLTDKNIHNKLSPSMSALIISSHVKEGLELAKKYRLPNVIQHAISQHHGTSPVSFFYQKALEQDPHKQVQEKDFRYPGPIPQTRENAVIMLADSVEAASRSLASSSPRLLRELVKKIIRDKFNSHQLDQCDLTLRDLDMIVEGFMPVLQGIFHTRIEYPAGSQ